MPDCKSPERAKESITIMVSKHYYGRGKLVAWCPVNNEAPILVGGVLLSGQPLVSMLDKSLV